ncbi:MAG: hypothetical protein ACRCZO_15325 [Cetobacterium sp.]
MKKVLIIDAKKTVGVAPFTSNVPVSLYNRLNELCINLNITKKALVITALTKLLDEIDEYGIEVK